MSQNDSYKTYDAAIARKADVITLTHTHIHTQCHTQNQFTLYVYKVHYALNYCRAYLTVKLIMTNRNTVDLSLDVDPTRATRAKRSLGCNSSSDTSMIILQI